MFNILLIVAGILEYVLLGIDFKVSRLLSILDLCAKDEICRTTSRTRILAAF